MRLRWVDGARVALCAVESDPRPGDLYLDDADHAALAKKFMRDWCGSGLIPGGPLPPDPEHVSQVVRSDADEAARWLYEKKDVDDAVVVHLPDALAARFIEFYGNRRD